MKVPRELLFGPLLLELQHSAAELAAEQPAIIDESKALAEAINNLCDGAKQASVVIALSVLLETVMPAWLEDHDDEE